MLSGDVQPSHNKGFFGPTCEEAAVVLLYFLRCFKLLLGMFLGEFLPQVKRVLLFSEGETSQGDSSEGRQVL